MYEPRDFPGRPSRVYRHSFRIELYIAFKTVFPPRVFTTNEVDTSCFPLFRSPPHHVQLRTRRVGTKHVFSGRSRRGRRREILLRGFHHNNNWCTIRVQSKRNRTPPHRNWYFARYRTQFTFYIRTVTALHCTWFGCTCTSLFVARTATTCLVHQVCWLTDCLVSVVG